MMKSIKHGLAAAGFGIFMANASAAEDTMSADYCSIVDYEDCAYLLLESDNAHIRSIFNDSFTNEAIESHGINTLIFRCFNDAATGWTESDKPHLGTLLAEPAQSLTGLISMFPGRKILGTRLALIDEEGTLTLITPNNSDRIIAEIQNGSRNLHGATPRTVINVVPELDKICTPSMM